MSHYKVGDEPVPGYRLVEFLGQGGFGEVWKATGPGMILVAMKIIALDRKQGLKEFRALRLVKGIHHPNLVPIMGAWLIGENRKVLTDTHLDDPAEPASATRPLVDTTPVNLDSSTLKELIIVMGLGDKSLGDRLEESPSGIPAPELLEYMTEAAKAIDFMNEKSHDLASGSVGSIQHCDIKPHNILIVGGSAQVCDFGLARVLGDVRKTSMGVSPAYGAPECLDGNKPSGTTDQYSLAVSYVELRTGELPFEDATSYLSIVNAHLDGNLDLSRLPPEEQGVIRRATARDPSKRFESATAMVQALKEAWKKENASPDDLLAAGEGTAGARAGRRRIFSPSLMAGMAGLGVALAVFALMIARAVWADAEIDALIREGDYQEACNRIESCPAWFGWLLAADRQREQIAMCWSRDVDEAINRKEFDRAADLLADTSPWIDELAKDVRKRGRELLEKRWYEEVRMVALSGETQQSEKLRQALLERFPDCADAKQPVPDPRQTARVDPPRPTDPAAKPPGQTSQPQPTPPPEQPVEPPSPLAAAHAGDATARLLADAAAKLRQGNCTQDDVKPLYLLAVAKSQSGSPSEDALVALDAYTELSRLARQVESSVPPLEYHAKILEPALVLANALGPAADLDEQRRAQIAALYGDEADLLKSHPYEAWSLDGKPVEMALRAYDHAISYDARRAKYHSGRGWCRLELDQLPEAKKDADAAIAMDPEFPDGYDVLGKICLIESRQESVLSQRLAKLREAVANYTKAIGLSKQENEDTAYALINRSGANVEICGYSASLPRDEKAKLLMQARDDALRAIKINTVYDDYAYLALGNALEDLAFVAGGDPENYDKAIEAFSEALRLSHHANPAYSLARGRCKLRATQFGKRNGKLLDSAVEDLDDVIRRDANSAEAYSYLGQVYLLQEKYASAEKNLRRAIELAPSSYTKEFYLAKTLAKLGKTAEADVCFAAALRLARDAGSVLYYDCLDAWTPTINPDDPATGSRSDALGAMADELSRSDVSSPQAKVLVGLVRESQRRWSEAVKAYDEGLASPNVASRNDLKYSFLYRRSKANYNLLVGQQDPAKQQQTAAGIGDRFFLDAEEAARWAADDSQRACALAQAATARAWLAMKMDRGDPKAQAIWAKAKELYRNAIRLAPNHPDGWSWRYAFVLHWRYHEPGIYQKGPDNAEAMTCLNDALKSPDLGQRERQMIGRLKTGLERGTP